MSSHRHTAAGASISSRASITRHARVSYSPSHKTRSVHPNNSSPSPSNPAPSPHASDPIPPSSHSTPSRSGQRPFPLRALPSQLAPTLLRPTSPPPHWRTRLGIRTRGPRLMGPARRSLRGTWTRSLGAFRAGPEEEKVRVKAIRVQFQFNRSEHPYG